MAQSQLNVTGKAGPVIYYTRNGKNCIRTKPVKVKQTLATKKRSSNFSLASTCARISRIQLAEIISTRDGNRHSRLTGAFSLWLKGSDLSDIPAGEIISLKNFEVNPPKMLASKWQQKISVVKNTSGLLITVLPLQPSEMMAVPKDTCIIDLNITTMCMPLPQTAGTHHVNSTFSFPCHDLFSGISLQHDLDLLPCSVVVTGFSITCYDENKWPVTIRKGYSLPAGIVYAEWLGDERKES